LTTSYDSRNSLALQYLSAMFGVEFRIAPDIRRDQCNRCNECCAITTCRVVGDSDSTSPDQIVCCISCLDDAIRKANTELRSGADVHVEVAARLFAVEGDVVELHAGTKCIRTRERLTAERYVVVDRPVSGFLLVRAEGDTTSEPSAVRFANVALICMGFPVLSAVQRDDLMLDRLGSADSGEPVDELGQRLVAWREEIESTPMVDDQAGELR
jgi:RNase P subunit RPR2